MDEDNDGHCDPEQDFARYQHAGSSDVADMQAAVTRVALLVGLTQPPAHEG